MAEYYLNYVGSGVYSVPVFEAEARRIGVSRGLPMRIIRTLSFGDKILLAQWNPDREEQERLRPAAQEAGGKYFRVGSAEVFGYFTVSGLSFRCEDPEMVAALVSTLHVQMLVEANERVDRMCGTGIIGVRYFVTDSVEDVIVKAQTVEREMGRGKRFKFFVTGAYSRIERMTLSPAKFSRGVVKVDVSAPLADELPLQPSEVDELRGYQRRMYVPKEQRERAQREAGA